MMVPFTDYDGAQAGDQGKNRAPHDHNRDYVEFLYPETKAITEWIGRHAGGKGFCAGNIHGPLRIIEILLQVDDDQRFHTKQV